MAWVAIGTAVVGGVASAYSANKASKASKGGGGGGGGGSSEPRRSVTSGGSSSTNYLDPRMEALIYGQGGIIPNASDWYKKNSSGMNEKMLTGMNNQWNQLGASKQGFDQMQNLGMGMMGGGVAGNPFTGGGGMQRQPMQQQPMYQQPTQNMAYAPANFTQSAAQPFTMPEQMQAPSIQGGAAGGGGGGGGEEELPWATIVPVTAPVGTGTKPKRPAPEAWDPYNYG